MITLTVSSEFLLSPEVFSHGILPIGVVGTDSDLSITVQTKSLHLSRHLFLTRHSKGHSTNEILGYLDYPNVCVCEAGERGGEREGGMGREGERGGREGGRGRTLVNANYKPSQTKYRTHNIRINITIHSTIRSIQLTYFSNSCSPWHCECSPRHSRPPQEASWLHRTSCCLQYGHQPDPYCRKGAGRAQ